MAMAKTNSGKSANNVERVPSPIIVTLEQVLTKAFQLLRAEGPQQVAQGDSAKLMETRQLWPGLIS